MSKQPNRPNLKDIIAATPTAGAEPVAAIEETAPAPTTVVAMTQPRPARASTAKAKAGQGTLKERAQGMSLYLDESVYRQLRELAFTEDRKMHGLVLEGLDLLFKKRGLRPIELLRKIDKAS